LKKRDGPTNRTFPVSIIADGMERRGIMDTGIKALSPDVKLCGTAVTVETRTADNCVVEAALKLGQLCGDLLAGICGEITTRTARRRGLAGL
jgi:regulator of RNase E activity RraA